MRGEFFDALSARYDELDALYAADETSETERILIWARLEAVNAVLSEIEAGLVCPETGVDLKV